MKARITMQVAHGKEAHDPGQHHGQAHQRQGEPVHQQGQRIAIMPHGEPVAQHHAHGLQPLHPHAPAGQDHEKGENGISRLRGPRHGALRHTATQQPDDAQREEEHAWRGDEQWNQDF